MIKVINSEKIPIKLWLEDIEDGALTQARNLANLPFAFKHIALMPDSHQGYGMPIGGVMAAQKVIVPNAVGVDIGCGMCAVKTSLTEIDTDLLRKIITRIKQNIPVGFKHHKKAQKRWEVLRLPKNSIVEQQYLASLFQIGTLGGGNHFIEIQKGSDNHIWIMLHSGSRNMGLQVARHYNKLAAKTSKKKFPAVPLKWELAALPLDDKSGQAYYKEMSCCVQFAYENRKLMLENIKDFFLDTFSEVKFEKIINIAHNYAAEEIHYGHEVIVHRKGATSAFEGQLGIIPGSQGTSSFIVKGKGCRESFRSCSHGAGRTMGRKQAQRELDIEMEKKKLDKLGIIHSMKSSRDLDEASGAYKDISVVMSNQMDLVDIEVELKPLAVVKG